MSRPQERYRDPPVNAELLAKFPRAERRATERHRGLIRGDARTYFVVGASFVGLCVSRQVITAVGRATERKRQALNQSVSESAVHSEDDGERLAEGLLGPDPRADPPDDVPSGQDLDATRVPVPSALTNMEAGTICRCPVGHTVHPANRFCTQCGVALDPTSGVRSEEAVASGPVIVGVPAETKSGENRRGWEQPRLSSLPSASRPPAVRPRRRTGAHTRRAPDVRAESEISRAPDPPMRASHLRAESDRFQATSGRVAEQDSSSFPAVPILRSALLACSAALTAIGAVVILGILHRSSTPGLTTSGPALDLAASRSPGHPASDRPPGYLPSIPSGHRQPGGRQGTRPPNVSAGSRVTPSEPGAASIPAPSVPPAPASGALSPPAPLPVYVNPLAHIANLQFGRIDQGVDYEGTGPLLALGSGTIRMTSEGGWPGGTFIALQLDAGQFAGRIIYYAENITPAVRIGQHLNAGDVVGTLHDGYPNMEIGWGGGGTAGGRLGNALARSTGGYSEAVSTLQGVNFNQFLLSLGAPGPSK